MGQLLADQKGDFDTAIAYLQESLAILQAHPILASPNGSRNPIASPFDEAYVIPSRIRDSAMFRSRRRSRRNGISSANGARRLDFHRASQTPEAHTDHAKPWIE
jgi:hypothetical protein